MKVKKIPVIVDAWEFNIADWIENPTLNEGYKAIYSEKVYVEVLPSQSEIKLSKILDGEVQFFIDTLEGRHRILDGGYVIRGVKGEFYPIKRDIFFLTYELVYAKV